VSDNDSSSQVLAELQQQLLQSRQQHERLKDALTRVLSLIDALETR
jgi:hypothetical protein